MKVEKIITTKITENLNITGATLLSTEQAEQLPIELRKYNNWWWLRSHGSNQHRSAFVNYFGSVNYCGYDVAYADDCVRPALQISNLNSSNLKVDDNFIFGGKEFQIISENLAFCKSDIGTCYFREDWESNDANDYEKSDVKKFVDSWFEQNKG